MSADEMIAKYESLHHRVADIEAGHPQDILVAFGCGCFTIMMTVMGVRFWSLSRHGRPERVTYIPGAPAEDGSQAALQELSYSRSPLIEMGLRHSADPDGAGLQ
jgi:hypothetical protein